MTTATRSGTAVLNGVPLYTRKGTPRSRFSEHDWLNLLGANEDDVAEFIDLFAPRWGKHIIRRTKDGVLQDWCTVHHVLYDQLVMQHLAGDRLPGREPLWVGSFCWDQSRWAAIDVDCRGDQNDFARRCEFIERQLLVLGIPRKSLLVLPSPSGGRHYYFFFYRRVQVELIYQMLANVGIEHIPGRYEIYPRQDHGFRLPFGYCPRSPVAPNAWLDFLQSYRDGRFPRVSEKRCWQRALAHDKKQKNNAIRNRVSNDSGELSSVETRYNFPIKSSGRSTLCATSMGLPKSQVKRVAAHRQTLNGTTLKPAEPTPSNSNRRRLHLNAMGHHFDTIIDAPGMRVQMTKDLAWHLVFAKKLGGREVEEICVEWAYRAGHSTSKDVQSDLQQGTRRVETQTRSIVQWMIELRGTDTTVPTSRPVQHGYCAQELDCLVDLLHKLPCGERADCGLFALQFLQFAKRCGKPTAEGWECSPSVRGILRKWPGCSGMRYKSKLETAINIGIVEMTKQKWQTPNGTGRARTFVIRMPVDTSAELEMDFDKARDLLIDRLRRCESHCATSDKSDTYFSLSPLEGEKVLQRTDQLALEQLTRYDRSLEGNNSVDTSNDCHATTRPAVKNTEEHSSHVKPEPGSIVAISPYKTSHGTADTQGASCRDQDSNDSKRRAPEDYSAIRKQRSLSRELVRGGGGRPGDLCAVSPLPRTRHPGGACSRRPRGDLATRTEELHGEPSLVPRLRDPAIGQQSTAAAAVIARRFLDQEALAIRNRSAQATAEELAAVPAPGDTIVMEMIFDHRQRSALKWSPTRDEPGFPPGVVIRLIQSEALSVYERWLLLANPKRLGLADSYRKTKLLRQHFKPLKVIYGPSCD